MHRLQFVLSRLNFPAMHINPERSPRPDYDLLVCQVTSVLEGETSLVANASQFSALVYDTIADLGMRAQFLAATDC